MIYIISSSISIFIDCVDMDIDIEKNTNVVEYC